VNRKKKMRSLKMLHFFDILEQERRYPRKRLAIENKDNNNSKTIRNQLMIAVEGNVDNEYGISKYFSPKGEGMLPGDIVWESVKRTGKKLTCEEGHVIDKGAENFQCRDCKYYMYYGNCLLIRGYTMDNNRSESRFTPEMSCGFIVKIGQGTEI
jgi:hypothetical protein